MRTEPPEPPEGLSERAKEIWYEVYPELAPPVTLSALHALERYCFTMATIEDLQSKIVGKEVVYDAGKPKPNPAIKLLVTYSSLLPSIARALGLNRSTVKEAPPTRQRGALLDFAQRGMSANGKH